MSNTTTLLVEELPERSELEALNLTGINALGADLFLMLPGSIEGTSASFAVLISQGDLGSRANTASGIVIFPQFEPLSDLVEVPADVGKRHEPMIRGKGVPVWVLVSYAIKRRMTTQEISRLWNGYVTEQEVWAALAYWQSHPEDVEDKLSDAE